MPPRPISDFLAALKAANRAANVPSISESTADLLAALVRERGTRSLLELWTAHGYSTIRLASEIRRNLATEGAAPCHADRKPVLTVDFSRPSYEAAVANVAEAGLSESVEHVFADALAFVPTLYPRTFDAVFLDAEKRSTARLFEMAWPLVNPGGWAVVDDVVKFRAKMEDFYELVERLGIPHEIVMTDPDDGVMVFRKP